MVPNLQILFFTENEQLQMLLGRLLQIFRYFIAGIIYAKIWSAG